MKYIKTLATMMAVLTLAACAAAGTEESLNLEKPKPTKVIDLMQGGGALPHTPLKVQEPEEIVSDSVEIQQLDPAGASSAVVTLGSPPSAPPPSGDPSVEVFPLDAPAPAIAYASPDIARPAQQPAAAYNPGGGSVYFAHGSAAIDGAGHAMIESAIGNALRRGGGAFAVEGHASTDSHIADPVQRKIGNLQMSMKRALSVARAMILGGVPAERIETRAYGEVRPAPTPEQSRRVDIITR